VVVVSQKLESKIKTTNNDMKDLNLYETNSAGILTLYKTLEQLNNDELYQHFCKSLDQLSNHKFSTDELEAFKEKAGALTDSTLEPQKAKEYGNYLLEHLFINSETDTRLTVLTGQVLTRIFIDEINEPRESTIH
jgi:hypothetical protein